MVISTIDVTSAARRPRDDGQVLRHRLDVLAADANDVVQTAGGWLFDRVMAGWEVNVMLPQGYDSRPLRILGVEVLDLESDFDMAGMGHGLAASVAALTAYDCVREVVRRALDKQRNRGTEVALWGEGWPLGVTRGLTSTSYRLSAAARAFKGQALRAAGIPCLSIAPTEKLLTDSAWLG